jgi:hypothetical protein
MEPFLFDLYRGCQKIFSSIELAASAASGWADARHPTSTLKPEQMP